MLSFSDKNLPGYDYNFDYSQSNHQHQQHFVKLESDSYGNNLLINNILKNSTIDVKKINNNEYNTISEIDNIQLQNSVVSVLSPPESDSGSVYDHPSTKSFNVSGISYNSIDHHSALGISSKNEYIYSNASSPSTDLQHPVSGVTSPENSVCSSNCPTPNKLAVNVNLKPSDNFELATPSIIEDVVQLENNNFNILEYMQNEVSRNQRSVTSFLLISIFKLFYPHLLSFLLLFVFVKTFKLTSGVLMSAIIPPYFE